MMRRARKEFLGLRDSSSELRVLRVEKFGSKQSEWFTRENTCSRIVNGLKCRRCGWYHLAAQRIPLRNKVTNDGFLKSVTPPSEV
jgi:hypothetical protein